VHPFYDIHVTILYVGFFFQAEDGIRDRNVTGVQTCALPISLVEDGQFALETLQYINDRVNEFKKEDGRLYAIYGTPAENLCGVRSEERRVGEEGRDRGMGSS